MPAAVVIGKAIVSLINDAQIIERGQLVIEP